MFKFRLSNIPHLQQLFRVILFSFVFTLISCTSTKPPSLVTPTRIPSSHSDNDTNSNQRSLELELCKMKVSNPPHSISNNVQRQSQHACVNGVRLLVAPAPKACLSSGFGFRGTKNHVGIDYQSKPAGSVLAAASGKVINVEFRPQDYGHWVIIDHGKGIYTSYAHLENVSSRIKVGKQITVGDKLGTMGKSGNAAYAVHLHYEMRKGNYNNSRKWWGLTAIDPFSLAASC